MSLRPCKECKQPISSDAKVCPHCGKKVGIGAGTGCLIVLGVLIGLGVIGSLTSSRSGRSGSSSSSPGASGASTEATPDPSLRWSYDQSPDSMGRGTIKKATVRSLNQIEFGFPYQEPQRGRWNFASTPSMARTRSLSSSAANSCATLTAAQSRCGLTRERRRPIALRSPRTGAQRPSSSVTTIAFSRACENRKRCISKRSSIRRHRESSSSTPTGSSGDIRSRTLITPQSYSPGCRPPWCSSWVEALPSSGSSGSSVVTIVLCPPAG